MKKVKHLLAIVILANFISITTNAQMKPGTLMLGTTIGSTAYTSANSNYDYDLGGTKSVSTFTYTLSAGPQIGVFVTHRLVLGGNLSVSYSNAKSNTTNISAAQVETGSTSNTNTLTVNVGPFARYYFSNLHSKNWFYAQANAQAGSGTGNSNGSSNTTTATSLSNGNVSNIFNWNAGASLGMTHLIDKKIGMDFSIGYNYAHQHNHDDNSTVTTKTSPSSVTTSTNNYFLTTGTGGITASVGFHFFL